MERANRYVYKIYETKSFSAAAKALYISQPSLSATVKKLENELGFEIFNRRTTPLSLTREGKIYLEYIEEALINEKNMHRRIRIVSELSEDKLVVVGTNYLSYKIIPEVFGILHKAYPNVELTANFCNTYSKKEVYAMLENGTADLMINYTCNENRFSYVPLHNECFVVAVRRDGITDERLLGFALSHNDIVSGKIDSKKIITDYTLFSEVEFLRVSRNSSIQHYVHKFIENGSISSCHIYNAQTLEAHYRMMLNGMGAIVTTDYLVKNLPESPEVLYFITDHPENFRQAKILYIKEKELPKIAQEFISTATEILSKEKAAISL